MVMMVFVTYTRVTEAEKFCSSGWTGFKEDKCFLNVREKMTWDDALNHCRELGGELAAIRNKEEDETVSAMIMNNEYDQGHWIGLRKIGGVFRWLSGLPVDYTNWSTDKPDPRYSCVFMVYKWRQWLVGENECAHQPNKPIYIYIIYL